MNSILVKCSWLFTIKNFNQCNHWDLNCKTMHTTWRCECVSGTDCHNPKYTSKNYSFEHRLEQSYWNSWHSGKNDVAIINQWLNPAGLDWSCGDIQIRSRNSVESVVSMLFTWGKREHSFMVKFALHWSQTEREWTGMRVIHTLLSFSLFTCFGSQHTLTQLLGSKEREREREGGRTEQGEAKRVRNSCGFKR